MYAKGPKHGAVCVSQLARRALEVVICACHISEQMRVAVTCPICQYPSISVLILNKACQTPLLIHTKWQILLSLNLVDQVRLDPIHIPKIHRSSYLHLTPNSICHVRKALKLKSKFL